MLSVLCPVKFARTLSSLYQKKEQGKVVESCRTGQRRRPPVGPSYHNVASVAIVPKEANTNLDGHMS